MLLRAWSLASLVPLLAAGGVDADVWAPGASAEPWPLIAELQRPAAGSDRWRGALAHRDPLVRAAAVWAAGRAGVPGGADRLRATTFDPDALVRDASLWALLQSEDRAARRILWDALGVRRHITVGGMSASIRSVGEPPAGFALLFRRRGLPFFDGDVSARREWLALVPSEASDDTASWMPRAPVRWTSWTVERSEWDAGERVVVRATVEVEREAPEGASLEPPETNLAALDEPDSGPGHHGTVRRIPVRLQRAVTDPAGSRVGGAGGRIEVALQLSLAEIPPGVYALEPFDVGHPLLLRVRRSARREADVQAAAASAATPQEIAEVYRQRVASQADRWRRALAPQLQPPAPSNGAAVPLPKELLQALAAIHDGEAARLLLEAVSAEPPRIDRFYDVDADHELVRAFGTAALPHLERAAAAWRADLDRKYAGALALSVLGSARLHGTTLDDLRVEVLGELGPRVIPPPVPGDRPKLIDARVREAFFGSLVAVTARRPRDAGRALAMLEDRPAALAAALAAFDPRQYTFNPYAPDLDGFDAMLAEAWTRLSPSAHADSRAAIAAEAERLSIALPGMEQASPESATEAVRELRRNRPQREDCTARAASGLSRTLRRVLASGLAERAGDVAVEAAYLARWLGMAPEATRLAELAVTLTPSLPDRAEALLVRAQVLADAGENARAMADLDEAAQHPAPHVRSVVAKRRAALSGTPSGLRVRSPAPITEYCHPIVAGHDGDTLVRDRLVFRRKADGGADIVGVAPFDVVLAASAGARAVAVLSSTGALGLLREGRSGLAWRVSGAGATGPGKPPQIAADERTVLVRDAKDVVRAFDAGTGNPLWTLSSDRISPLALRDGDPVVLAAPAPSEPGALVLTALDARTGRAVWTRPLAPRGHVHALRIADGRVAWYAGDGTLMLVDGRTGETVFSLALPRPAAAYPGVALALVPRSTRLVVAFPDRLLAVEGGEILWSRELPTGEHGDAQALEAGEDGTLWRVVGPTVRDSRVVAEARDGNGETVALHRFADMRTFSWTAMTGGRTLVIAGLQHTMLIDRVTP